jgi:hypothetical protein
MANRLFLEKPNHEPGWGERSDFRQLLVRAGHASSGCSKSLLPPIRYCLDKSV